MPRRCSVSGCRSNYDGEGHITTFHLPKSEPLRSQWIRKISTDFTSIKCPVVCLNHFEESYIIRTDCCTVKGELKEFSRKIPKLKDGALPTIFPNAPSYLSTAPSHSRRLVDVEQERLNAAIKESLADYKLHIEQTTFHNIDDISSYLSSKKTTRR